MRFCPTVRLNENDPDGRLKRANPLLLRPPRKKPFGDQLLRNVRGHVLNAREQIVLRQPVMQQLPVHPLACFFF
jgi:hypothetical protein